MEDDPILRPETVASLLGKSVTTLWRRMKAGQFPKLIRTGKYVGWRRSTIERWLREHQTHAKEATSHLLAKLGNAR
jgi:predicted DNA-binding transcriptional regulator AlpA